MTRRMKGIMSLVLVAVFALGALGFATAATLDRPGRGTEVLKFDLAENGLRFIFAPTPVHEDGMPAYGNSFVTEGYIYPHGTLNGTNGVLENGAAEFPDKVIGKWTCRGWFVGDGAHTLGAGRHRRSNRAGNQRRRRPLQQRARPRRADAAWLHPQHGREPALGSDLQEELAANTVRSAPVSTVRQGHRRHYYSLGLDH